jgi:hypothetical protein
VANCVNKWRFTTIITRIIDFPPSWEKDTFEKRCSMNISVYDLIVPQFTMTLNSLKNILTKAQAYAETKKIEPTVLLNTRLAPDQFPLGRQIQIACDTAKNCVSKLAAIDNPVHEDKEQSLDEFMKRIDKTILFLQTVKPDQFKNYEAQKITSPHRPGKAIDGKSFLVQHAIPNLYFHVTTAYSILRANGVDLGKKDYLGPVNWKDV